MHSPFGEQSCVCVVHSLISKNSYTKRKKIYNKQVKTLLIFSTFIVLTALVRNNVCLTKYGGKETLSTTMMIMMMMTMMMMMMVIIIIIIIPLFALGRIFRANTIVAEQMHEPNNLNQT